MTTTENGFVSREQFLSKRPRRIREIDIPDFGKIRVQELTAYERGKFESRFTAKKAKSVQQVRELIAIESVVDANGSRMFTDSDIEALGSVPAHVMEAITKAYHELNSSDDADIEALVGN